MMKPCLILAAAAAFLPVCAHAQAAKPCEELRSEIAAKLDAKGVQSYSLDVVAKEQDAEGKVVGTCDGGTRKIVYHRGAAPAQAAVNPATKQ
jgi:outer membrane lipoprotein-sorting protein